MSTNRAYRLLVVLVLLALVGGLGAPVWAAPPAEKQSTGTVVHVVQWGETLTTIARRYGVTTTAIVQANGLANPNYIWAGQRLVIPSASTPSAPAGETSTYVVCRGDTLGAIAARFGTTVNAIASLNSLWNPNLIHVGQVLRIPGRASPTQPTDSCIYVVKRGDNLTRIALSYGTTVWALAIANNLANPSFIWVGQHLLIPHCGPSPGPSPTTQPQATSTATTQPRSPTSTPTSTSTPQVSYLYQLVQGPTKDPCHPGFCVPEVSGSVVDAHWNPVSNANPVWIKLVSETQGTMISRTGDPGQLLQAGLFKFVSQDGDVFGPYTLTIIKGQHDHTPLSATYQFKMNSYVKAGQQSNIVFQTRL